MEFHFTVNTYKTYPAGRETASFWHSSLCTLLNSLNSLKYFSWSSPLPSTLSATVADWSNRAAIQSYPIIRCCCLADALLSPLSRDWVIEDGGVGPSCWYNYILTRYLTNQELFCIFPPLYTHFYIYLTNKLECFNAAEKRKHTVRNFHILKKLVLGK